MLTQGSHEGQHHEGQASRTHRQLPAENLWLGNKSTRESWLGKLASPLATGMPHRACPFQLAVPTSSSVSLPVVPLSHGSSSWMGLLLPRNNKYWKMPSCLLKANTPDRPGHAPLRFSRLSLSHGGPSVAQRDRTLLFTTLFNSHLGVPARQVFSRAIRESPGPVGLGEV